MSAPFQRIEGIVNKFVGQPITWFIYLIWLAARWCCVQARNGWSWARDRYSRIGKVNGTRLTIIRR